MGYPNKSEQTQWSHSSTPVWPSGDDSVGIMSLLIFALILIIVLAVVCWIITRLPIPEPWRSVVIGIVVLIGLLVLVGRMGYLPT